MRAVAEAMIETWQAREKIIANAAIDQIPSLRIACNALESLAQVRRLLGMRIVAGCARGLARFSAATVAFGDAQPFPQDRVQTPDIGRSRRRRRVRESNFFALRFA
jgi:hypothetical protein